MWNEKSKLGHLRATNESRKPNQAYITRGDPALLADAEKCSGNWRNFNMCCNLIIVGLKRFPAVPGQQQTLPARISSIRLITMSSGIYGTILKIFGISNYG